MSGAPPETFGNATPTATRQGKALEQCSKGTKLKIMWNGFQPPPPALSTRLILWLIVNALRGKCMWSWLFGVTEWVTVGAIAIKYQKKKKSQKLVWNIATWLSDRLTSNPAGITLPCSLLAKCQCPTWLLSYTVWCPQAALRDTVEVPRFALLVSFKPSVHCYTLVWTRWRWRRDTGFLFPTTHTHIPTCCL